MNFSDKSDRTLPAKRLRSVDGQTERKRKATQSPYFKNVDSEFSNDLKLRNCTAACMSRKLNDSFFNQSCITLAKKLLGKTLTRKLPSGELLKGIIVETESYLGIVDEASHTFNGKRTERNEAMYLKPGTAYVYTIYGMYYCFNISSLEEGSAVLIRAVEPLEGISTMKEFRSKREKNGDLKIKELCSGPSKLCQAFQIDKDLNKDDLCLSDRLWVEEGINVDISNIVSCKRIGVDSYGEEWGNKSLRFYIVKNIFVSRKNKIAENVHFKKLAI